MSSAPDPNLEILKSLSVNLASNIKTAELETKRSKKQLEELLLSKGLVDESLKALSSASAYQAIAKTTLFPTSSMALPMSEQFDMTPPGPIRSLISSQIQTTIFSGVSSFIAANPVAFQIGLTSLKVRLSTQNEELLSLEQRLGSRLAPYSEHLEKILSGALESYRDAGNPTRFVNTGNLLRELYRVFMQIVAPDDKVQAAPWFVHDKTSKNGVTRRHRINYAIFKWLTRDKFPKKFADQVDKTSAKLLKEIDKLSALAHVTEDVLEKIYTETAPLFATAMQRFLLLISAVETSRMLVEQDMAVEIQLRLDDIFTDDLFDELDQLSTHTRPQGAVDIQVTNLSFDETRIKFSGTGRVECDLQYGSDGDVSRGDGIESSDSFPFTFSGRAPIGDLSAIEIDKDSIFIDTSSFYE